MRLSEFVYLFILFFLGYIVLLYILKYLFLWVFNERFGVDNFNRFIMWLVCWLGGIILIFILFFLILVLFSIKFILVLLKIFGEFIEFNSVGIILFLFRLVLVINIFCWFWVYENLWKSLFVLCINKLFKLVFGVFIIIIVGELFLLVMILINDNLNVKLINFFCDFEMELVLFCCDGFLLKMFDVINILKEGNFIEGIFWFIFLGCFLYLIKIFFVKRFLL